MGLVTTLIVSAILIALVTTSVVIQAYRNSPHPVATTCCVLVVDTNIGQPTQTPNSTTDDLGRVSVWSFSMTSGANNTYTLAFDNSFSTSPKIVNVTYVEGQTQNTTTLNVPAGQARDLSIPWMRGVYEVNGNFSVSGGSGGSDDGVNFSIVTSTSICSETVPFSYDLENEGPASVNATSAFESVSGGSVWWSHSDVVNPGAQVPVNGTAEIPYCGGSSDFTIAIVRDQKV